jgi:hypothetical protein
MVTQLDVLSQTKILVGKRSASEILDLCPRTIDYLVAGGELPVVRVGRRVLFRVAGLEAFARRRSHRTGRAKTGGGEASESGQLRAANDEDGARPKR